MSVVRAAGAVLWRERDGLLEVALVHRPRHDDWSLPKGKLDAGEGELAAALREVGEETGYVGDAGAHLGQVRYAVAGADKTVRYWAMHATHGTFAPNDEVDELRWLEPPAASRLLTYDLDREVLDRFLALPR